MSHIVTDLLAGPSLERRGATVIAHADGRIAHLGTPAGSSSGARRLVVPALANAHDHGRPLSPTSFGGSNKPLESWILRLGVMPPVDPYLVAAASLGRAARGGCASVMVHCTRLQGPMSPGEEVSIVARAAADVGVRVTFALFMRDLNPIVYAPSEEVLSTLPADVRREVDAVFSHPMPSARAQVERVEANAAATENPMFSGQFGPSGAQWCSDELLEAIAEASARTGRRVHMHLLETKYQRAWADRHHPEGIVRHLKNIGLLSPRLALAHCVYANDEDLELIAESGAVIVTNASSNLHLRSGIAPIARALKAGCRVAMGVDASALDEDDDALREMRLGHFLHAGWGFDEAVSREAYYTGTLANGRFANGAPGSGVVAEGEAADYLVLDLDRLDQDAVMPVDPLDFLFARAHAGHIAEVVVAGRTIVRDGRPTGVDLDAVHAELRAQYRDRLPQKAGFIQAWPTFEPAVAAFYRDRMGCC